MNIDSAQYNISPDCVQSFTLFNASVAGRLVRLDGVINSILERHNFPDAISVLLAESLALVATLGAALKFNGVMTLQTKSNGFVEQIVVDMTTEGNLRAYAKLQNKAQLVSFLMQNQNPAARQLLGDGHLVVTVDQNKEDQNKKDRRYQGVVALSGSSLVDAAHTYFKQSAQQEMVTKLAVSRQKGRWHAAALTMHWIAAQSHKTDETEKDQWHKTVLLHNTVKDKELLDWSLSSVDLLQRLFYEDDVRLFKPMLLYDKCRCSHERLEKVLVSLNEPDLQEAAKKEGLIRSSCQFCRRTYAFTLEDVHKAKNR